MVLSTPRRSLPSLSPLAYSPLFARSIGVPSLRRCCSSSRGGSTVDGTTNRTDAVDKLGPENHVGIVEHPFL